MAVDPDEGSDKDQGPPWEPLVQHAADLQQGPFDALEEILRWHEAELRKEAEVAATKTGGFFDFDELPKPEPQKAPARRPVRLAERAAQRAVEDWAASQNRKTARQQIQEALNAELESVPLGDKRRRALRERARQELASAPADPPPSKAQTREWARLLCLLQREAEPPQPGEAPPLVPIEESEAIEILQKRADVHHQVGDLQRCALHAAAERCYTHLLRELIKVRADPNKADLAGEVPLHTLAHSGGWCEAPPSQRRLAVERLVEGRADVNFANPRGRTPLHIAASSGDGIIITALLGEGADVNAADLGGFTPLMWAAGHGSADTVQTLLDAGADMSLQAKRGQTAMLFALTNKKTLVMEALEGHNALLERLEDRRKALRQESEQSSGEVVQEAKQRPTATAKLYDPYRGKVREEFAPSLSSNVY